MHTLHQIEHHPLPPIYLDEEQLESLTKNITFLQEFLETYPLTGNSEERYRFESRIAGAAYMAADIVESHIVDQIQDGNYGENIISVEFYRGLQRAIEDLDLIKKEALEMKAKMGVRCQLQRNSSMAAAAGSSASSSTVKNTSMVGFDDVLLEILDKLTQGKPERQIIPIVGMGGIGKTTLARNTYMHPLIKEHFDICAWVTISQEFDAQQILKEVLRGTKLDSADSSEKNENEIGGDVSHKYLFGRRYLIIMDDMWSIEAWNKIKFFFPDCNNGSRIIVTTRLSDLARQLPNSCGIDMKFLDRDKSWDLFSKIVFEEEVCPPKLEGIGKKIVRSCGGLPLSIVVIGGILASSGFEREYWEHIEENLNSILMNSENNEQCSKILEMSYNHLPAHLKPCFLYLIVYTEDSLIRVSELVRLWIAEGFIKAVSEKTLEEVGEEYVKDLVDRNLIFVHKLRYTRKRIEFVKIHDLLRDFCLRQDEKERFCNVVSRHGVGIPQDTHSQRCMFIREAILEGNVQHTLLSMPLTRSLICDFGHELLPSPHHRLLRIFDSSNAELLFFECHYLENQLVNLRYVLVGNIPRNPISASPLHLLWNLQTLIIKGKFDEEGFIAPVEFWNMPHLRHVIVKPYLYLSDPPSLNLNREDEIFLANLQTLTNVRNFKCGQEVVKRIPNVKKLMVNVIELDDDGCSDFDLSNLDQLHKLETFVCKSLVLVNLTFPHSLKKLSLDMLYYLHWEDMMEKIGSLPLLQKLVLRRGWFRTGTWETVEGQFPNLKVLKLRECGNLSCWTSECSHFPRLERLVLDQLHWLDEIPSSIGEIQTLQSIVLKFCSQSLVVSAKRMQEEQEELYGEEVALRVRVKLNPKAYEEMRGLEVPNFELQNVNFFIPRGLIFFVNKTYFPQRANNLEGRIRDVAYEAEDKIENLREQILYRTKYIHDLEKAAEKVESMAEEVMNINNSFKQLGDRHFPAITSSLSRITSTNKDVMVGFDEDLMAMKARLCGESSQLQVISIHGMGGIGKTTLARSAYHDPLVTEYFLVRAWVTVSQDYSVNEVVSNLLVSMKMFDRESYRDGSEERVYKSLKGRRYLIVMDDMWSKEAWDDVRNIFPDDNNGSRIILTTRLSEVAAYPSSYSPHEMCLLDDNQSWRLLQQKVFEGETNSPPELQEIGKKIAKSCGGLPLAIVVVAGLLLSTASKTQTSWREFAENGFLKHKNGCESLEEEAEMYVEDLVMRSLVFVTKRKSSGKIKSCSVHDLVQDLIIRKAEEEKFLLYADQKTLPKSIQNQRRLSLARVRGDYLARNYDSTIRSMRCFECHGIGARSLGNHKLLRVLVAAHTTFGNPTLFSIKVSQLSHLKHLDLHHTNHLTESISKLQNLETLIVRAWKIDRGYPLFVTRLPSGIWKMPQLRHLVSPFFGPLPLPKNETFSLESLRTFSVATNFPCSQRLLQRIPNLQKLGIFYLGNVNYYFGYDYWDLQDLVLLHQLETLKITIHSSFRSRERLIRNPAFPASLRKLTLSGQILTWERMTIIGSLPNLQVLKLRDSACKGRIWETDEGEFLELRFLLMDTLDLREWVTESSHFPKLKSLLLHHCMDLNEIPDGIGEIPTLELIEVSNGNKSLVESAKRIQEEQQSMYGDDAPLQVRLAR
ncbi:hypothetical protein C2S51_021653 [Perilla frutescens var. frutescens]|nr:hypothetical protein C2S51_021653 [Perilla frutescens var. frutescens]